MHVEEILRTYLARNLRIESDKTRSLYRYVVADFAESLNREPTAADFTDDNLAAFIQHRRQLGRSPHTIDREADRLLTLWRCAAQERLCPWPRIKLKSHAPPIPEAWLRPEVESLFAAAGRYPTPIKGVPGGLFLLGLLGVFWDTGERLTPVLDLARTDVDLSARIVRLRGRKAGARDMVREISRATADDVRRLLAAHNGAGVFAGSSRATVYYHLPKLLTIAGLPVDRRSKFHRLRRSHASHLHAAGGDATASLGHSSDAVTRASYLDSRVTRGKSAVSRLFNPRRRWWRLLG